jgi:hypothetical protein
MAQEGGSVGWCNPQQLNLSVDVLRARKHCERLCKSPGRARKEVYVGQNGDFLVAYLAMKSPTCL